MQTVLLHAVACSQVAVLYFLAAPLYFQLIRLSLLRKNPQWLADHPDFLLRHPASRWPARLARLLGLAWLLWYAVRLARGAGADQPWLVLYAPMLVWVALEAGYATLAWLRLGRPIPLPARRRASLTPRTLAELIDPRLLYPAYFLLAALVGLYLAGWQRGAIDGALLAERLGALALALAAWGWTLDYYLRRKPQLADASFGARYRRLEIIETVLCLYALGALYVWLIAQDVFGIVALSPDALLICASVLLQILLLAGPRYGSLQALFAQDAPVQPLEKP